MKIKNLFIFAVGILAICIGLYFCFILYPAVKETHNLRSRNQVNNSLGIFYRGIGEWFPPDDIFAEDGTPLLSWRVAYLLENARYYPEYLSKKHPFQLDESWNTEANLQAAKRKPNFFMYPYRLEKKGNMKTCVVLVKEVAELKRTKKYEDRIKDKALVVLVDPEHAVQWTAPVDVSWKDLASGKIKSFNRDGYFFYVRCGGVSMEYLKRHPGSYEEWAALCDVAGVETSRVVEQVPQETATP